jgi:hypothetical protein
MNTFCLTWRSNFGTRAHSLDQESTLVTGRVLGWPIGSLSFFSMNATGDTAPPAENQGGGAEYAIAGSKWANYLIGQTNTP